MTYQRTICNEKKGGGLKIFNRENIVSKMFHCEVEAGQYVFKQNDNASSYFILST